MISELDVLRIDVPRLRTANDAMHHELLELVESWQEREVAMAAERLACETLGAPRCLASTPRQGVEEERQKMELERKRSPDLTQKSPRFSMV